MISRQEKKRLKEEEAAKAKQEAEFDARFKAKQERKKVEKIIADMEKQGNELLAKAAEAKQKGQATAYRNYVSGIKLVRARKAQAENFLSQVDVMQSMQSITSSSKELLSSMGNIMNSLGKLTLDRSAMAESQREFAKTQQDLDKQGGTIESFLSGMEMVLPEEESSLDSAGVDQNIDAEIDSFLLNKSVNSLGAAPSQNPGSVQADIEQLKQVLQK